MSNQKVLSQQKDHEAHTITHSMGHKLREPLVIQFSEYRGRDRVSLRFHYVDNSNDLAPTRRGIEFAVPMLDSVIEALQEVKEELEELGTGGEEIP